MQELMIERIVIWPMLLFLGILLSAIFELLLDKLLGVHPDKSIRSAGLKVQTVLILSILWILILYAL